MVLWCACRRLRCCSTGGHLLATFRPWQSAVECQWKVGGALAEAAGTDWTEGLLVPFVLGRWCGIVAAARASRALAASAGLVFGTIS